jgi:hypothetical protein
MVVFFESSELLPQLIASAQRGGDFATHTGSRLILT